jgi:hypothetical protein
MGYPSTPSAATVIRAADVKANLDYFQSALTNLDSSALADDAGIESTQIADRYAISHLCVLNTGLQPYTVSGSTSVAKVNLRVPPGKRAFLLEVQVYCLSITGSPRVEVQLGGTTLGGASKAVTGGGNIELLGNASPVAAPVAPFDDNDQIEVFLSNTGSTTVTGLMVTLVIKEELAP